VVPRPLLLFEKQLAVALAVLALLLMRLGNVDHVELPLPLLELGLGVVYQVDQILQDLGQLLLFTGVDINQQTFLHAFCDIDDDQTQQQGHECPSAHQQGRFCSCVLKDVDDDEVDVESANKELDSDEYFLEFEVVAIEGEEKFREDCQIACIGDVHDDEEEDRIAESWVVHHVDHWSDLDDEFAHVEPVRRTGHETLGKRVAVEVVHCIEEVYQEQPETVEDPQHHDKDLGTDVAVLAHRERIATIAVKSSYRGLEDRNCEDCGIAHREEVDEGLHFVFVEVSVRNRPADLFRPFLVGPVAYDHQDDVHHIQDKEQGDEVDVDVALSEEDEQVDVPGNLAKDPKAQGIEH
jgi:hypothetical protein